LTDFIRIDLNLRGQAEFHDAVIALVSYTKQIQNSLVYFKFCCSLNTRVAINEKFFAPFNIMIERNAMIAALDEICDDARTFIN
jgi:hypothetical protein